MIGCSDLQEIQLDWIGKKCGSKWVFSNPSYSLQIQWQATLAVFKAIYLRTHLLSPVQFKSLARVSILRGETDN